MWPPAFGRPFVGKYFGIEIKSQPMEVEMPKNTNQNPEFADLYKMAASLHALKKQASELGLFTDDRELLECSACGLKESVTGDGFLYTYKDDAIDTDTGLRFPEPDDDGSDDLVTNCPECGTRVQGEWL